MKPIRRPSREALAWLGAESALQRRRCRALAAADAALARRRARWAEEFLARLATRGFDEAAGVRRPVRPEELPAARGRRLRATTAREATMARTDPLTGLFNRRAFIELATREVARAERYHRSVSIAYMDIDKFKAVNDAGGHKEGDRLLVQVAETLRGNLRSSDVVARYGGDEFVVLLPDTGDAAAEAVLEKLMGALRGATRAEWPATFSIGFITVDRPSVSLDRLVQEADTLAYAAKRAGGDCVRHRHLELGGAAERVDSVRNAAAEKVEYPKALAGGRGR